jgi:putative protease
MAYSGRCQISNYFTGRDPNKGACVQACRFKYKIYEIEEEMRKGEKFQIYEENEGSYILNSKDLCMIEYIPNLIEAGITSFKIEVRLKSLYYVAMVTRAWRKAIDLHLDNHTKYDTEKSKFKKELEKVSNRGFTTGFYFHRPNQNTNNYKTSRAVSEWGFVGIVKKYDKKTNIATVEVKNHLPKGANLEIVTPDKIIKYKLREMCLKGKKAEVAHANYIIEVPIAEEIPENSFIRMKLSTLTK